ncbi:hypothetical protein [Gimesia sp.]|uniref:hypothetical protein n=1 Tax=Gimesia sp. TaxID=2024833 RepID=UPI003A8E51AC
MYRIFCSSLLTLLAMTLLSGCSFSVSVNAESDTDLGSHHVVVKPGNALTTSSSSTFGDSATHTFECGDVKVKIDNEALFVNDLSYGMLEEGQSIEIDHGKVFVAGQERTGKPVEELDEGEPVEQDVK